MEAVPYIGRGSDRNFTSYTVARPDKYAVNPIYPPQEKRQASNVIFSLMPANGCISGITAGKQGERNFS
jgi:hypothetical protein